MTRKTRDDSKRRLRTLNATDLQAVTGGGKGSSHTGKPGEYTSSSGGGGGSGL